MPTSLSHSPTKTTGLRWHSASMKHLGKTNLGHIYTGFVGQSLCLWTACCRLACVHTAESWECLLGTDQPTLCSAWSWPPASLQIYVFIYMFFDWLWNRSQNGCCLQPPASFVLWEVTRGTLGVWGLQASIAMLNQVRAKAVQCISGAHCPLVHAQLSSQMKKMAP